MSRNHDKALQKPPKAPSRQSNHIQNAIGSWIARLPPPQPEGKTEYYEQLLKTAPKRFTIYEPLALLPSGSFTDEAWESILQKYDEATCNRLWSLILKELSKDGKGTVTHLAVNEGIPLHKEGDDAENVRRSPTGLRLLSGDFGPVDVHDEQPTADDFAKTLWVRTKQNGIHQTWAPRWTMFSRGNIKEKARLLGFERPARGEECWAVDLYAGIGYFTFSYASLGMRVLCWEINPWSVEGLRRGAKANKWSVKVIQGDELTFPLGDLLAGEEQITVFLESNEEAVRRIREMQGRGLARGIRHVNCGFLPTSEPTWASAWEMTRFSSNARLHLHENVGSNDIESRRRSIEAEFVRWCTDDDKDNEPRIPNVEHVEKVKTFAPGVWHCVFDVCITRSYIGT